MTVGTRFRSTLIVLAAIAIGAGCTRTEFPNAELKIHDPSSGYRFDRLGIGDVDDAFIILAFSGGGMRASALAYGVLEELNRARYRRMDVERSLLDEVDIVSSVSGGSVSAAYFALRGKEVFSDFKDRFLYQDILGELSGPVFNPITWLRLSSPNYSRIDVLAELFDRRLFQGKTYAALTARSRRPFLLLNAADMSSGAVVPFTQEQFDAICSDLTSFRLAKAVAASAAFPVALTPVTLKNYSGKHCAANVPEPRWISMGSKDKHVNLPRLKRARLEKVWRSLPSADRKAEFIHLLDGGIADNLGLRGPLLLMSSTDRQPSLLAQMNMGRIKKIAVIVVNARSGPDNEIDRDGETPGITDMVKSVTSVPIDTVISDSRNQLDRFFTEIERAKREFQGCNRKLTRICGAEDRTAFPLLSVQTYRIEVDFDLVDDPVRRKRLKNIATTWTLKRAEVDELRLVACQLLQDSPGYNKLLSDLGASPTARCRL